MLKKSILKIFFKNNTWYHYLEIPSKHSDGIEGMLLLKQLSLSNACKELQVLARVR